MSEKIDVTLKLMYEDASTRTITFSDVEPEALRYVKSKVLAINENVPEVMKQTFVSASGSPFLWISEAIITETEERVIYDG